MYPTEVTIFACLICLMVVTEVVFLHHPDVTGKQLTGLISDWVTWNCINMINPESKTKALKGTLHTWMGSFSYITWVLDLHFSIIQ